MSTMATTLPAADITIRLATRADADACNAFHVRHYGDGRTTAQWLWEFGEHADAAGTLPFVIAEHRGSIVGTQAVLPVPFRDTAGRHLTGKSEETLVTPEAREMVRRQGGDLFGALMARVCEEAARRGMRRVWGFTPAESSFARVGFQVAGRTRQLVHPISPRAVTVLLGDAGSSVSRRAGLTAAGWTAAMMGELTRHIPRPRQHAGDPLTVTMLDEVPETIGDVTRHFVAQWGGLTIDRDRAFLDWRIARNPYVRARMVGVTWRGSLVGFGALALDADGMGHVVDLTAADATHDRTLASATVGLLLAEACRRLRDMGALAVRMWRVGTHPFSELVARTAMGRGFLPIAQGHPVVVRALHDEPLPPLHEWYVTRLNTEGRLG